MNDTQKMANTEKQITTKYVAALEASHAELVEACKAAKQKLKDYASEDTFAEMNGAGAVSDPDAYIAGTVQRIDTALANAAKVKEEQ